MLMRLACLVGATALAGCTPFGGLTYDERLDGSWRLRATDVREDMMLCRGDLDGGDCFGDMLTGATVFAAGIDARYVVLAKHPRVWPDPSDRTISEYYFIVRVFDAKGIESFSPENLKGPFDAASFEEERRRLALPSFSRVFEDLK